MPKPDVDRYILICAKHPLGTIPPPWCDGCERMNADWQKRRARRRYVVKVYRSATTKLVVKDRARPARIFPVRSLAGAFRLIESWEKTEA